MSTPEETHHMLTVEDLQEVLRTVAERLSNRPWTTGVEATLREVADELDGYRGTDEEVL